MISFIYKLSCIKFKKFIILIIFFFTPINNLLAGDFSLEFDGTDDYVEVPFHATMNPADDFSVNAWVKTQDNTDWQSTVTSRERGSGYMLYQRNTDQWAFWTGKNRGSASWNPGNTTTDPVYGTWQMQTVTYDHSETKMRLYIDGVELSFQNADCCNSAVVENISKPLRIAAGRTNDNPPFAAGDPYYFKGHIDEVAIWNVPLSAAEITQLFNSGETLYAGENHGNYISASGLQEYWTMDTIVSGENNGSGTKLYGELNNNDGDFLGAPTWSTDTPGTSPTISSRSPDDNASNVADDTNIVITFSETIKLNTGNIFLKKSNDDSIVETFDVSSDVTLSASNQITINPTSNLEPKTDYYVFIDASAIIDISRNHFDGIGDPLVGVGDKTTYNFSTGTSSTNPLDDKDVIGLIEAQTDASKKIVSRVTNPIFNRLNWIRGYSLEDDLRAQKINFEFVDPKIARLSEFISQSVSYDAPQKKILDSWSFWSEGSVGVGSVNASNDASKKDINTNAVTLGMDKKIDRKTVHGFTFTYTQEDVDVGNLGTSSDIDSYSFSAYRTINTAKNLFLESVLGISKLNIENTRISGSNTLNGNRNGKQIFGSLQYINIFEKNNSDISPNIRLDVSHTILNDYKEIGTMPLNFDEQTVENIGLYGGINFKNEIPKNNYILRPSVGFELGLDLSPNSDISINYVSDPNTKYTKSIDQDDEKSIKGKVGFDVINEIGPSMMFFYERVETEDSHSDTLYFLVGYVTHRKDEFALELIDQTATVAYKQNINGLNISLSSEYDVLREYPDYEINLNVASNF